MKVTAVPALEDNYIWFIEQGDQVIVVDPGQGEPVLNYLKEHHLNPLAVLLTHKHADHTAGVEAIKTNFPEVVVYGPTETQDWNDRTLTPDQSFSVGDFTFKTALTAGHTAGHISYLLENHLFCGDALFMAGCGRVFTGDYAAQFAALQWFKQLPDQTFVYAGHEYSLTNLRFAQRVSPHHQPIRQALALVQDLRDQGQMTLPSTIGQEKAINPFLRANSLAEFIQLRKVRDDFS
ncbi:hydroxyacylglutathione hydrolase [Vaginisenegalia massiliensis]|uniref:hydroxyacylglutathione hydrolase n=1 Tax=Vaginisenegalia massiliensis TaxID=2058294 RepID=UPI000F547D8A|nr:hydroxyacylglutathione hydrolase [Vaginisenegalia massiliensis]